MHGHLRMDGLIYVRTNRGTDADQCYVPFRLDGDKDQKILFSSSKEYTSSPSTQWTTYLYNGDDTS